MFITIGLPFYNAEFFLKHSIQSVFAQTHQEWELILIDDGSTDESLKIAKSIIDPRVRVLSDGKNKKLAARLNEIVRLAKYDLIARMDADDIMSPTRLEKQLKVLLEKPEVDIVSTGLYSVSDSLEVKGVRWHSSNDISFDDLLFRRGCGVVHAAILGRKIWFQRNGYDESLKLAQDYELWLRASNKKDFNVFLLQEPLYYYREEGSINSKKMLLAYKYEREMYKKYVKSNNFPLIFKSYIKSLIVVFLSTINQLQFLINRRSNFYIDKKLLLISKNEIEEIRETKVNGL
jgi:glycosyltransferase involved in cell wall biosynthesis